MSQFGMQMPGGRVRARPGLDVYAGLLFLATVLLILAFVVVWIQGSKIAPDGDPLKIHEEGRVSLPSA